MAHLPDSVLSEELIQLVRSNFRSIDTENTGYIEKQQILNLMKILKYPMNATELGELLDLHNLRIASG